MSADNCDWDTLFPGVNIPQEKPVRPKVADHLEVRLQSLPALGQATVLHDGDISLMVVLEIPRFRANESWEVQFCCESHHSDWTYLPLLPVQRGNEPQTVHTWPKHLARLYFSTTFSAPQSSFRFTFAFRSCNNEPWRSIRNEQGIEDGQVIITPGSFSSDYSLRSIIPTLNPAWEISPLTGHPSPVQSWVLRAAIPGADGDISAVDDVEIGAAWDSFIRWFALVRISAHWIAPRQGKSEFKLDKDAILCSFLSPEGKHMVFLAANGCNNVLSLFRSTPEGGITVHARNDGSSKATISVVVAIGDDFDSVLAAAMRNMRALVSQGRSDENAMDAPGTMEPQVKGTEDWYDGLGYCTWNAMGQDVTGEKILSALSILETSSIQITNLLIDDGWQSVDNRGHGQFQRGMNRFQANPDGFPDGLKSAVSLIREKHPNIQNIAVWHALLGYWGGISPNGEIASKYKTVEAVREDPEPRNLPVGGKMTLIAKEDVFRFYDDFYRFLADAGIDGVKTDSQSMVDTWVSAEVRRELITPYLDAWAMHSRRHFGSKSISCMSQIPQNLFRCCVPGSSSNKTVMRNSDDFFPEVRASQPLHVWANAHNSLLTQHLNVVPDWDMFQTVGEYAGFHAAARCMSGGPIYITDLPGQHDIDLIHQMTGTTPDGKTTIFRPTSMGKSVSPYSSYEDDLLLKLGAYHKPSETPVLAIFNISTRPLTELIPLSCFPAVESSKTYVIRAHSTGIVSLPTSVGCTSPSAILTSSQEIRGYEIYTACPLQTFTVASLNPIGIANMGLLGKMTGCAAVIASFAKESPDKQHIVLEIELKSLGVLGVYVTVLPDLVLGETLIVSLCERPITGFARASAYNHRMLEVDLESAWQHISRDEQRGTTCLVRVSIFAR